MGHSGRTLLYFKSAKQAFRMRLPPKVTRQASKTSVSRENSFVKSPKRAFRARLPRKLTLEVCKTSVRAKLPPKVTRQVSKPSVSYETSSKSQAGSPSENVVPKWILYGAGHFVYENIGNAEQLFGSTAQICVCAATCSASEAAFYTNHRLHQATFYTNHRLRPCVVVLHQPPFTANRVYTNHRLRPCAAHTDHQC